MSDEWNCHIDDLQIHVMCTGHIKTQSQPQPVTVLIDASDVFR